MITRPPLMQRLRDALWGGLVAALALVVALSSTQMVTARATAASVERIVICSGYGMMTVELDADGNPVGPMHLCPECMAAHLTAVLPEPGGSPAMALRPLALRVVAPPHPCDTCSRGHLPEARAPPVDVL